MLIDERGFVEVEEPVREVSVYLEKKHPRLDPLKTIKGAVSLYLCLTPAHVSIGQCQKRSLQHAISSTGKEKVRGESNIPSHSGNAPEYRSYLASFRVLLKDPA